MDVQFLKNKNRLKVTTVKISRQKYKYNGGEIILSKGQERYDISNDRKVHNYEPNKYQLIPAQNYWEECLKL